MSKHQYEFNINESSEHCVIRQAVQCCIQTCYGVNRLLKCIQTWQALT